jgi:hypothetical protein
MFVICIKILWRRIIKYQIMYLSAGDIIYKRVLSQSINEFSSSRKYYFGVEWSRCDHVTSAGAHAGDKTLTWRPDELLICHKYIFDNVFVNTIDLRLHGLNLLIFSVIGFPSLHSIEFHHFPTLVLLSGVGKTHTHTDLVFIDQQSVRKRSLHQMDTVNAKKRWTTI